MDNNLSNEFVLKEQNNHHFVFRYNTINNFMSENIKKHRNIKKITTTVNNYYLPTYDKCYETNNLMTED